MRRDLFDKIRKRIFEITEQSKDGDRISYIYDTVMLVAIITSIIPLTFSHDHPIFKSMETITVTLFIIDYLFRWITADLRLGKKGWSFAIYPFTGWAIIDLLSILPGLAVLGRGFKLLRITRLLRILRLFKLIRYSDKIQVFGKVIVKERCALLGHRHAHYRGLWRYDSGDGSGPAYQYALLPVRNGCHCAAFRRYHRQLSGRVEGDKRKGK